MTEFVLGKGSTFSISTDGGATYIPVKQLRSVVFSGTQADLDEITNMDSEGGFREWAATLIRPGMANLEGVWAENDPGQQELMSAFDAQQLLACKLQFVVVDGEAGNIVVTFAAYAATRTDIAVGLDAACRFTTQLKITGPITDSQTAAFGWENAKGTLTFFAGHPLGNPGYFALWNFFSLIPDVELPPDAVIQGIYPVIVLSNNSDAIPDCRVGTGLVPGANIGSGFPVPTVPYSNAEVYRNSSIGTSLSVLSGQEMMITLGATLENPFTGVYSASAMGFAIYYTSAHPVIDITIPAPFAVPSGQGLAWAKPFGTVSGPIETGKSTNGSAVATPTQKISS